MNLKDNYIIKSVKSRPILFILTAIFTAMFTYQLTSGYSKQTIEEQQSMIAQLEAKVHSLESETIEVEEIYDEETGKLISKKIKKEKKEELAREIKKELKKDYVKKEEITKYIPKNYIYVGKGIGLNGNSPQYVGYSRRLWMFEVGTLIGIGDVWSDYSIAGTIGVRF